MDVVVVVPDLQVPFHHTPGVRALTKFIRDFAPDDVYCVGDVLDAPHVSRWHRGLKGEFLGTLSEQRDEAVAILGRLGVRHLSRSNHDDRVEDYVQRHAPGLDGLPELQTETFLRLDDIGCEFHRMPWEFAPGWFLAHGDEGPLSSEPGKTARNLTMKWGASVVIGHTHRAGMMPTTDSVGGEIRAVRFGVEVGCLMDLRKADYIMRRGGAANWQLAFGVLEIDGANVQPHIVYLDNDGAFTYDRHRWTA